jgi:hypothetical protein
MVFSLEIMACGQPKGVKVEMRVCKLISSVNWQGVLKQKSVKQGLGVLGNRAYFTGVDFPTLSV